MSTDKPPTTPYAYPDRSERLILLGVIQVLLGCLCGLMVVMMVGLTLMGPLLKQPQGPAMNTQMLIPAMMVYLPLAVALIWLGTGLMRARRWAWTLTVVLSWMWLVVGVLAFAMFAFFMAPSMFPSMAQQANMPREMMMMMEIVVGVFLACIYILLPGVFLVLCHHESVRATCQRRDPKIPWTDRCPMPVLALSITLGIWVLSFLSSVVAYRAVIPMFGVFISGAAGAGVILLIGLALLYLAWGTYRLQMAAWWGTLLFLIAGTANMAITFSRTDLMEMYEKIGMPPDQLELIRKTGVAQSMSHWMPWMGLVGGAGFLVYLLYVHRYFVSGGKGTMRSHLESDHSLE